MTDPDPLHPNRTTTAPAGPRDWLGLAVLALPTLLLAMDVTVLYLAVPHLTEDLRPTGIEQLWIADIYGFMIAGFLITMGTVGDRIGRRKLLMIGAAAFAAASALAAFATGPLLLIAARALLGIAGATLMPSTLALISNMFRDAGQRAMAIGVWATCLSAGMALGPIIGGSMLESFWWGSVFLLAVPVMALLLVTAPILLPEYRDPEASRVDLPSVLLSLATILPVIFGIKKLAEAGLSAVPVAAIAVGIGFGLLFVRRQGELADPLLDLRLFGNPTFRAALLILLFGLGTVGGIYLFITQYLQLVRGLTPLGAGLWLLPPAGALILASMLTPIIARKVEPRFVVTAALAIATLGYLTLAFVDAVGGLPVLVSGFVLVYVGISPLMVLGTDLVIGTTPPAKAGSAAAMSETSMEFGVATGIAVLGVIGTAIYRAGVAGSPVPGVQPRVQEAAEDSLSAADAAATDLPAHLGDTLLSVARDAFTSGLNSTALVCAAITAALTAVALTSLRPAAASSSHEADRAPHL
ncbi:MFS transporter [Nocardia amikacinitolerans]|uniref:MFS transporter n=1 Tax=Nocardia amikacinitolerans TaxID=756689 RepID=UPI0020A38E97|nr:MFS transporter [Nocardia amikacinitolerans]MCP2278745.1 MFS transporter, DHA2 family, multidrug resistance protein [Nocardia amikacinitolerans]